ncbi:MAG: hypothetical protein WBL50_03375 [Candidatus Acidiferrum sp.]
MHLRYWILLIPMIAVIGCQSRTDARVEGLTPVDRSAVEQSVRGFMASVAQAVTQEGPTAWSKEFESGANFFMAVNGKVAFPTGDAAAQAIPAVARAIPHIDLKWGDDLRVDPLTADLAVVGSSYQEIQVDPQGHTVRENGYFTGVAERRNGTWQFRNAHWSEAAPAAKAP